MKRLLLLFILILASSTYAADLDFDFINASCDYEGRGIFKFNVQLEEPFNIQEAGIKNTKGDWYSCSEVSCAYDYYLIQSGAYKKDIIKVGGRYQLITRPLLFMEDKVYSIDFTYPSEVDNGKVDDFEEIEIELNCPGYDFSCSIYDFEIDRCTSGSGKFRMDLTAKGIDQPHKVDLIRDFRYGIVGEQSQLINDRPLTDASVRYKANVVVEPEKAKIYSIGRDRYYIEFPYEDTAKWLNIEGKYCMNDEDRFGKSNTFEFLTSKKCELMDFVVTAVEDEPEPEEEPEEETTKFYPVPEPKEEPITRRVVEEPEPEAPKQEITLLSIIRMIFDVFRR